MSFLNSLPQSLPAPQLATSINNVFNDATSVAKIEADSLPTSKIDYSGSTSFAALDAFGGTSHNFAPYALTIATGTNKATVQLKNGTAAQDLAFDINGSANVAVAKDSGSNAINLSVANFSNIEVYATVALRNSASNIVWHVGDIATVTGTGSSDAPATYIYSGTDQTTAATTNNNDWTLFNSSVSDANTLAALNGNDGSVDINDNLIPVSVARTANVVAKTDNLSILADVSDTAATDNQVLAWDASADSGEGAWVPTGLGDITTDVTLNDLVTGNGANGNMIWYDGTDNAWELISAGAAGQILATNAAGVPSFANITAQTNSYVNLGHLKDVNNSTLTSATADVGKVLTWSGSEWAGADVAATLGELTDVAPPGAADDGEFLQYTHGSGWAAAKVSSTAVQSGAPASPSVGDLWFDSDLDSPRLFVYTGTEDGWVQTNPTAAVPDAPTQTAANANYALQVTSTGTVQWINAAAAALPRKGTMNHTAAAATYAYALADFTAISGIIAADVPATIPADHTIIFNGLTLIQGSAITGTGASATVTGGDYVLNEDNDGFIFAGGVLDAMAATPSMIINLTFSYA